MLKLSKKSDYALLIISKLLRESEFISLTKLVEHTKLPQRFLARISAVLASKKVLLSREGRVGGYKLGPKFQTMSVFDFLSIFENNLLMTSCQKKNHICKFEGICHHKEPVKKKLNDVILSDLQKVFLKDLFSSP